MVIAVGLRSFESSPRNREIRKNALPFAAGIVMVRATCPENSKWCLSSMVSICLRKPW